MQTAAQILWICGSAVLLLLTTAHLYFTFFSNKFSIRNGDVEAGMKTSSPVLTSKLTVWNAWIGFNASHSSGGMFMGLINIYLAVMHWDFLMASAFIQVLTIGTTLFLLLVVRKYWFTTPNRGITLAFACYLVGIVLMHV